MPERFPLPPGFTRKMFDDMRIGPNVRPLVGGRRSATSGGCCGCCSAPSGSCCSSPARTSRTCSWCAPKARQQELAHARGARRELRPHRAGAALGEPDARRSPAASLGLGSRTRGIGLLVALIAPARAAAARRDRASTRSSSLFTLGISLLAGLLFGAHPGLQVRARRSIAALKEGGRSVERRPRASSRPQRAGRRARSRSRSCCSSSRA